jgi:hypothetical protein
MRRDALERVIRRADAREEGDVASAPISADRPGAAPSPRRRAPWR